MKASCQRSPNSGRHTTNNGAWLISIWIGRERLTSTPRDEVRWIRRGTTWELSDKKASFTEEQTERDGELRSAAF